MQSLKVQEEEQNLSFQLFIILSRVTRALTDLSEEDIKRHGLNPTEFAVLELLYHKGDQAIQQIGKKVLLASGSITYVVDKLEKKQLIERKHCPKDRRVIYAIITEGGKDLMRDIFPKYREAIHKILGGLSKQEKEALIKQIKRLGLHVQVQ